MLAAAHTLTAISRDLPQRLLFPDAPNLRNEFGGGTEGLLRATRSQAHFDLPVPTKGQAGQAVPKAGARCWMFVPVLWRHRQSREFIRVRLTRDLRPHFTNVDFFFLSQHPQARPGQDG